MLKSNRVYAMDMGEPKTTKQVILLVIGLLGLAVIGVLLAVALGLY